MWTISQYTLSEKKKHSLEGALELKAQRENMFNRRASSSFSLLSLKQRKLRLRWWTKLTRACDVTDTKFCSCSTGTVTTIRWTPDCLRFSTDSAFLSRPLVLGKSRQLATPSAVQIGWLLLPVMLNPWNSGTHEKWWYLGKFLDLAECSASNFSWRFACRPFLFSLSEWRSFPLNEICISSPRWKPASLASPEKWQVGSVLLISSIVHSTRPMPHNDYWN